MYQLCVAGGEDGQREHQEEEGGGGEDCQTTPGGKLKGYIFNKTRF